MVGVRGAGGGGGQSDPSPEKKLPSKISVLKLFSNNCEKTKISSFTSSPHLLSFKILHLSLALESNGDLPFKGNRNKNVVLSRLSFMFVRFAQRVSECNLALFGLTTTW